MSLYIRRPRLDEERIGRGMPSDAYTTPVRIYKFCAVDIFGNITRRQAISAVAKFHHLLGRGFVIQRVILILIICLSANQKQTI